MIEIKELPKRWIKEILTEQRNKLAEAEKAEQWKKVESFQKFLSLRREIVALCEKYNSET